MLQDKVVTEEAGARSWMVSASALPNMFHLLGLLLLLLGACCVGKAQQRAHATPALRTLTTTHEAHSLTATEAIKGYPIHIKGVITLYDEYVDPRHVIMFLHDATGSIYFTLPHGSQPMPAGTLVDLRGVSGMGDFAPVIERPIAKVIGSSKSLPEVKHRVSLTRLLTGEEDGQWVEVDGVIHSVFETEHNAMLQIAMRDGMVVAKVPREQGEDYTYLEDSRVLVRAHAAPVFNGDRQMIGVQLLGPGRSAIRMVDPGPTDVFQLPVSAIRSLSRFDSMAMLPRRVHVRGRVTLSWPGSLLCVQDATHGLCAHTLERTRIKLGETVDVAGFTQVTESVPSLDNAIFRRAALVPPEGELETPTSVTADQALNGNYGSELVTLEGQLIGNDVTASDTTMLLASQGYVFAIALPRNAADAIQSSWQNGSKLRVTGICSVKIDRERSVKEGGAAKRESFRILLRSSSDVVVLQKPSWWTPMHAVVVLAIVLTAALIVLCWVVVLSKRLKEQKTTISASEERFRYMAQHDPLTGLPTRLLLRERMDTAIDKARRSATGLALLMLDLDKFKQINDSLGHHAGDEALKVTAQRVTDIVHNSGTVARISGDEFVVLLTNIKEPSEAESVAAKVVNVLSTSFQVGHREIPLSASVGVCTGFGDELDAESLLKSVDTAMYHAKAKGKNRFQLYTKDMARRNEHHLLLHAALERALQNGEMEVHYQPMVGLRSNELCGFEALMRWRSKELGLMLPADFIPVAEETGLILPLGEWILRQACREIGCLEKQLGRTFLLAVNLSPKQIQPQSRWPQIVESILTEAGRPPKLLELEITESMLMNDSVPTQAALTDLRALGVRLAIDDFGIGFSSLSYITRFAIDRIKIDRSFIRQCTREGASLAVVRAMIAMAHGLSMQVVAEGVETAAEFDFLCDEGCDIAQGYFLSQPVPARELPMLTERLKQLSDKPALHLLSQTPNVSRPLLLVEG